MKKAKERHLDRRILPAAGCWHCWSGSALTTHTYTGWAGVGRWGAAAAVQRRAPPRAHAAAGTIDLETMTHNDLMDHMLILPGGIQDIPGKTNFPYDTR